MAPPSPAPARAGECVLVVAYAGYGKTTALEASGSESGGRLVLSAADLLDGDLPRSTSGGPVAVDDLDRLTPDEQRRLLSALAGLPPTVTVWLASRTPVHRSALGQLRRPVLERVAGDLALSPQSSAKVLRDEHGLDDADVADRVHRLTAGWPALVHLAGDALSRPRAHGLDVETVLTEPDGATSVWLDDQVLSGLAPQAARVLEVAVDLTVVSPELCAVVADAAPQAFTALVRGGLLVADPRVAARTAPSWRPVPLVAALLTARRGRDPGRAEQVVARRLAAADWYRANGFPLAAASMLRRAGRLDEAVSLVEDRGDEMLAGGGAVAVVEIGEAVPVARRSRRLTLLLGDALRMAGEADAAARLFAPLVEQTPAGLAWPPDLAWRVAMVRYMTGDYRGALAACRAAAPAEVTGSPTVDVVHVMTGRAAAEFMLGDTSAARSSAEAALAAALLLGDQRCVAAAHTVNALTTAGATRERHLRLALDAATAAADVVQLARVLVNQADGLLDEARYAPALAAAQAAQRAAELGAPPGLLVTAVHNVGEALLRLGRYEEAEYAFDRTVRLSRRAGLARAASGLRGLGELRHALGLREQSRMVYEEAVELARASGEIQVLVPALVGQVRVLADPGADGPPDAADVASARVLADEALLLSPPDLRVRALVARGWVALADADLARARDLAAQAVELGRSRRSEPDLAEALELVAVAAPDPAHARAAVQEAVALWERAGATPAMDRMLVLAGRLPDAGGAERAAAREAGRRLLQLGVQWVDGRPLFSVDGAAASVRVRVLGGFEVVVAGRPVPLPAWRSRQARVLVKVLVARRGRPVPRGEVCELLWPDDEPQRTAHRLSVLLSVVRTVLDPARSWPADHYIRADLAGLSLVREHVSVDAEALMRDAAHAVRLVRDGDVVRARELLGDIDAAYLGEAFDDEPYEAWADALREQTRSAWLQSLRLSAELAVQDGDDEQAVSSLVRLLAADSLDESAYRVLVRVHLAAGRHGEARRTFDRWTAAMRSIDAPLPDPRLLRPRPGAVRPADTA